MSDLVAVLSADTSQLQRELNSARNILQKYTRDATSLNGVSAQQAEAFRKSTNSLNTLINSGKGAKAQMSGLKREVQNLAMQYSQLSDEAKNGEFGRALANTINEANSKLQTLQKNIDATSAKMKNTNSNGTLNLKDMTSELSNINPQLGSLISMSSKFANPYVAGAAAIVGVSTALVDYNKVLSEQVAKVQEFTDVNDESAVAIRNGIKSICDTYNSDFSETMKAANSLAQHMGISYTEALDQISLGFAAGANASGDFLDQLDEYSTYLNEAGMNTTQMISLMVQAQKQGIFSDKALDAIKEANLRLREMPTATQQALQAIGLNSNKIESSLRDGSKTTIDVVKEVSEKLNELPPQASEVGQAIADIFGGPGEDAGLEYIKTLKDISGSTDELMSKMTEQQQATYNLQKADQELEDAMASLFGMSNGGFNTMTKQLKTNVYRALTNVINRFIELYNKSTLIRAGVAYIALGFKNMWIACKTACKLIGNAISGLADVFEDVINGDFSKAIADWAKHKSNIATIGKEWGNELGKNLRDALNSTMNGKINMVHLTDEGGSSSLGGGKSAGGGRGLGSGSSSSKGKSSTDKLSESIDKFLRQLAANAHNDNDAGLNTKKEDEMRAAAEAFWKEKAQAENDGARETSRKQELYQRNLKGFNDIQNQVDLGKLDPETAQRLVDELNEQLSRNEIDIKFNLDTSGVASKTQKIAEGMQKAAGYTGMLAGALRDVNSVAQSDGLNIAAIIAQAVAQVVGAYAETLAKDKSSKSNIWSFIAAAAASTISMATTIASMKSAGSYASGGIIGGTTTIGDYNIAHVNSGEMILNGTQQGRLFNILNGTGSNGTMNSGVATVDFKIKGKNLVGVQKNYYKRQSRL